MTPYQLGLYEKSMPGELTLHEKLAATRRAGYDYLELSIDETDEKLARLSWSKEEIGAVVRSIHEQGVPIKSICLSGHRRYPLGSRDPAVRKRSLEIMEQAIRLSAQLGVRLIQLAGYDVYYEESSPLTVEYFSQNLAAAAEMAAREGVILSFETMETEFMNTVGKAMRWIHRTRSPYVQVYPDVGNLTNAAALYGTDVLADLNSGQGHLAAIHLKETAPGVFREIPYGAGHVEFVRVCTEALRLGVRLFVGEFWHIGEQNWTDILVENRRYLADVLGRAAENSKIEAHSLK